jgi:hypothetical protein
LKWVNVAVPTQYGTIMVDIEGQNMQIRIPKGTELEWKGQTFKGPQVVKESF